MVHEVALKRAYEGYSRHDGLRVLVDRLWPRGLTKDQLAVDFWIKEAAPTPALRRWFDHKPGRWRSFSAKYRAELAGRADVLRLLDEARRRGRITLIYGASDTVHNHAVVLREVLEERGFPDRRARNRNGKRKAAGSRNARSPGSRRTNGNERKPSWHAS
jgi:uncharacterized protein YeaO (DUF488 family)